MEIAWSFNELMEKARWLLRKATDAGSNGYWESAEMNAFRAMAVLEIVSEARAATLPHPIDNNELNRPVKLLEIARRDYEVYHHNHMNLVRSGKADA